MSIIRDGHMLTIAQALKLTSMGRDIARLSQSGSFFLGEVKSNSDLEESFVDFTAATMSPKTRHEAGENGRATRYLATVSIRSTVSVLIRICFCL